MSSLEERFSRTLFCLPSPFCNVFMIILNQAFFRFRFEWKSVGSTLSFFCDWGVTSVWKRFYLTHCQLQILFSNSTGNQLLTHYNSYESIISHILIDLVTIKSVKCIESITILSLVGNDWNHVPFRSVSFRFVSFRFVLFQLESKSRLFTHLIRNGKS